MKILFICFSTLKFNVRTPAIEPLGGTESALAYLSVALAKQGHDVHLMGNMNDEVIDGVTHHTMSEDIAPIAPDVVIVTSAPQAAPGIKKILPNTPLVLWNHMRPDQPAMLHFFQPDAANAIDYTVYVSESQRAAFDEVFNGLKASITLKTKVINNAIAPCFEDMFSSADEILAAKKCKGVYTSTPFRGLAILAKINELPIDVYSSMRVYQGDDAPFKDMYANLKTNDCLDIKGSVSQTALRDAMHEISFLVYPSIFAECHSIAIIEAMAAGLKVITTDVASPPTEYIDSLPSASTSVAAYAALLRKNITFFRSRPEAWAEKMWEQVQYVNREFTWMKRAVEWEAYLHLVTKLPETP